MYHVAFHPRSNRASWVYLGLISDLDDNPLNLTGLPMVFEIRDKNGCARLAASTDIGNITVIALGIFRVFFTLDQMRTLCPGTYMTGLTITNDDGTQTEQLTIGPLPIEDGIVP